MPLVALAVLGAVAAVWAPQVRADREVTRTEACDALYHALDGELASELTRVTRAADHQPSCGDMGTAWPEIAAIRCVAQRHASEPNPRDPAKRAYVDRFAQPWETSACQVGLDAEPSADGPIEIRVVQQLASGEPARSFTIHPR